MVTLYMQQKRHAGINIIYCKYCSVYEYKNKDSVNTGQWHSKFLAFSPTMIPISHKTVHLT